jgi:hypothetical protein
MKMRSIAVCLFAVMLVGISTTSAQPLIPPGGSKFNPPLPPPPPPPKIEVPVVPQMDVLPRQSVQAPHPSFGDKITTCLQEGAAGGLGPSDREEYSRACANSR